jgi:hypothetical protein
MRYERCHDIPLLLAEHKRGTFGGALALFFLWRKKGARDKNKLKKRGLRDARSRPRPCLFGLRIIYFQHQKKRGWKKRLEKERTCD